MTDDPVDLDGRRGMAAQKATLDRRESILSFQADQAALQRRQAELEHLLLAKDTESWPEIGAKAQYLIQLFAATPQAQDPRRQKLIANTLEDIERMAKNEKD